MYVNASGDWCHRQPALISGGQMTVFPMLGDVEPLRRLCTERVDVPTKQRLRAEPWPVVAGKAPVLLALARFPHIASEDAEHGRKGYISENDAAFFVPMRIYEGTNNIGVFCLNPFVYVNHPVGVIEGREIFGFQKILATIDLDADGLGAEVKSLVFHTFDPQQPATEEIILTLERGGFLERVSRWFGNAAGEELGDLDPATVTGSIADKVLRLLGGADAAAHSGGFAEIRLALLKQFRAVKPGGAGNLDPVCYQDVVSAVFEIQRIHRAKLLPLPWPRTLRLVPHASVQIASTLGIDATPRLHLAVQIEADLRLTGNPI